MRKNKNVYAVKGCTRNVLRILAGFFALLCDHDRDNLTLDENGLGAGDGLLTDPFLGKNKLLGIELEHQVFSNDVDAIGVLHDAIELMQGFRSINFCNDLNFLANVLSNCEFKFLQVFACLHAGKVDILKGVLCVEFFQLRDIVCLEQRNKCIFWALDANLIS
jgi:hypothetical protein